MNRETLRSSMFNQRSLHRLNAGSVLPEVYNAVFRLLQSSANYDKDTRPTNIPLTESRPGLGHPAKGQEYPAHYAIESGRAKKVDKKSYPTGLLKSAPFSPRDHGTNNVANGLVRP